MWFENTAANGNRVMGVARINPIPASPQQYTADVLTCELPASQAKLCETIVNTYIALSHPQSG